MANNSDKMEQQNQTQDFELSTESLTGPENLQLQSRFKKRVISI